MSTMRRVKYYRRVYEKEEACWKDERGEGYFHAFGIGGVGNHSVGIIEMYNGRLCMVNIDDIQFINSIVDDS